MTVLYLGLIIEEGKIQMDPVKMDAITQWPVLTAQKPLQLFLGFMNFYRRFVKDIAWIVIPLNKLTGKMAWEWTQEQQDTFDELKRIITEEPILVLPNKEGQFMIKCDDSDFATGAILSQQQPDRTFKPVAFLSNAMTPAE